MIVLKFHRRLGGGAAEASVKFPIDMIMLTSSPVASRLCEISRIRGYKFFATQSMAWCCRIGCWVWDMVSLSLPGGVIGRLIWELSSYPGYFREPHWFSILEISSVTWQLCNMGLGMPTVAVDSEETCSLLGILPSFTDPWQSLAYS